MGESDRDVILIVDDDPMVLQMLEDQFDEEYEVIPAASGREAVNAAMRDDRIATVIMDIKMAGMNGTEAAARITETREDLPIIFHTGFPGEYTEAQIEERHKPFGYVVKGGTERQLRRSVREAVRQTNLRRDVNSLREAAFREFGMLGKSEAMAEVFRKIYRCARNDDRVLITGETGTGKGLAAKAIHLVGDRKKRRFAWFDCSHKPSTLIEAELFGHMKGAFTDASETRQGIFEYIDGGTILLDEIGELPMDTQVKLLRVIETGEFQKVGSPEVVTCDVRFICATNADLEQRLKEGRFRRDLFYRVDGQRIHIPPLRERREDIPLLIDAYREKYTTEKGEPPKVLSGDAMSMLIDYDWPGNVREVDNVVKRLIYNVDSGFIGPEAVPAALGTSAPETTSQQGNESLAGKIRDYRRNEIVKALAENDGNISATARALQVDRSNLRRWMRELDIPLG